MSGTPEIVTRDEQPYLAIKARVRVAELGGLGQRLAEFFAWLGRNGMALAGPSFFGYDVVDMMRDLDAGIHRSPPNPAAQGAMRLASVVSTVRPSGRERQRRMAGVPGPTSRRERDGVILMTFAACAAGQRLYCGAGLPGDRDNRGE
jgi:hypothetical protein